MELMTIHAPNDVRRSEVPKPTVGPKDVLVQVKACGICGSDLGYVAMGGLPMPEGRAMPIGHELSGVVVEKGSEVSDVAVGQRVVVNPEGAGNRIGNGGPEGGFAPYLLVRNVAGDAECLHRLPDSLSDLQGALVEPLAVAMHAVNQSEIQAGEKAVVFGAGPIGLGAVVCLRYRGVEDILVVDLSARRLELALALGANAIHDASSGSSWEAIRAAHGQELALGFIPVAGSDVFIDASGAASVVRGVVDNAKFGGRLVVVGLHKEEVSLHFLQVMMKELSIKGSMAYPNEFTAVIEMLASGKVDVAPMVSHTFDFSDFEGALATAQQPKRAAKVVVRFPD